MQRLAVNIMVLGILRASASDKTVQSLHLKADILHLIIDYADSLLMD